MKLFHSFLRSFFSKQHSKIRASKYTGCCSSYAIYALLLSPIPNWSGNYAAPSQYDKPGQITIIRWRERGNGIFVMEKRARCLCPCFAVILSVYPRSMLYRIRRDKGPPRRVFMEQTIPNQLSLSVSLPWWGLFLIQACRENTPLVSKDSRREYVYRWINEIKINLAWWLMTVSIGIRIYDIVRYSTVKEYWHSSMYHYFFLVQ